MIIGRPKVSSSIMLLPRGTSLSVRKRRSVRPLLSRDLRTAETSIPDRAVRVNIIGMQLQVLLLPCETDVLPGLRRA
jgi:hypothetical protein